MAALATAAALTLTACGGGTNMPVGPGPMGPSQTPSGSPAFISVSPGGGAMGVPMGITPELHWGIGMSAGMEQFVDLHLGDVSGPVVPMSCAWSTDQTTLGCTPSSPLQGGTQYTMHVGGGMTGAHGQVIDMDQYGPGFGGQWVTSAGQPGGGHHGGAHHGGHPWGGLGPGWQHANGSYGMAFTFTTA
jgi:hypothetical protein